MTPPETPSSGPADKPNTGGKLRNPKDVLPPVSIPKSKEDLTNKIDDAAKQAVVQGAAKAADSVAPGAGKVVKKLAKTKAGQKSLDVGVKTVKKSAKIYIRAIASVWIVAILLVVSMCGGEGSAVLTAIDPESEEDPATTAQKLDVPPAYYTASIRAASEHNVPFSLLLAVSHKASNHGRDNPYGNTKAAATELVLIGDVFPVCTKEQNAVFCSVEETENDEETENEPTPSSMNSLLGRSVASIQKPKGKSKRVDDLVAKISDIEKKVLIVYPFNNDRKVQNYGNVIKNLMSKAGEATVYWLTVPGDDNKINISIKGAEENHSNLHVLDWHAEAEAKNILPGDTSPETQEALAAYILDNIELADTEAAPPSAGGQDAEQQDETQEECPTVIPGIKPPVDDLTKGYGPLMLKPSELGFAKDDLSILQSVCDSFDILAKAVSISAQEQADEDGMAFPAYIGRQTSAAEQGDPDAAEYVNSFWAAVMGRLPVLGYTEGDVCTIMSQKEYTRRDWIALAIDDYWSCVLRDKKESLYHVTDVDDATKTPVLSNDPVEDIVREALDVAWLAPKSYNVQEPSMWDDSNCSSTPKDIHAGVFPLTAEEFAKGIAELKVFNKRTGVDLTIPTITKADRCDPELNIAAAAQLFLKGESVPPSDRPQKFSGMHETMLGGWSTMSGVVKSNKDFDIIGPWKSYQCSDERVPVELMSDAVQNLADSGVGLDTVDAFLADPSDATLISQARAEFASLIVSLKTKCSVTLTGMDPELYSYMYGFTLSLRNPPVDPLLLKLHSVMAEVAQIEKSGFSPYNSGSLVSRLSHLMPMQQRYDGLPDKSLDGEDNIGLLLLNIARSRYLGVFVNGGAVLAETADLGAEVEFYQEFNSAGRTHEVDPRILAAIAQHGSGFDDNKNCGESPSEGLRFGLMYLKDEAVCDEPAGQQIDKAAALLKAAYTKINVEADTDYRGALLLYYDDALADVWVNSEGDLEKLKELLTEHYAEDPREDELVKGALAFVGDDRKSAYRLWQDYRSKYASYDSVALASDLVADLIESCPKTYKESQISGQDLVSPSVTMGMDRDKFLHDLCVKSVTQSRSLYAMKAIVYVFNQLGVIYNQNTRNSTTFDCSSYVSTAYRYAGVPLGSNSSSPTTPAFMPPTKYGFLVEIEHVSEKKPGDLFLPSKGHIVMVLANNKIASAPRDGGVTWITNLYLDGHDVMFRVDGDSATLQDFKIKIAPRRGDK